MVLKRKWLRCEQGFIYQAMVVTLQVGGYQSIPGTTSSYMQFGLFEEEIYGDTGVIPMQIYIFFQHCFIHGVRFDIFLLERNTWIHTDMKYFMIVFSSILDCNRNTYFLTTGLKFYNYQ